jgi:hypothetical protein
MNVPSVYPQILLKRPFLKAVEWLDLLESIE